VLIARSGATAGKSYVHQSFGERAVFAGYLIRFQPDTSKVLPRFIEAFLQTPEYWQQLNSHKRAVAQPNVNAKQLASLVLPLPPLPEQTRIVNLLGEADELRKLRAQANGRSADLIPAVFYEMFGDGQGFPTKPLIELVEPERGISYGVVQRGEHYPGGVRLLRIADFGSNRVEPRGHSRG
jgi:type I restriction enzyme S subunit